MSNRASDYPEQVINSLPRKWQRFMALRTLEGWRFECGALSDAGNRWWQVRHPDTGKWVWGVGGLQLVHVLQRVNTYLKHHKALR